ncbi:MAG: 1-acyl-sn-glycerol-3-phosphate acyltransferase [Myxococcales bacterium]|nr:1-acyl-sn-glycerol-3-phosphate acyltransferase [Myxococcales bacterium]
MIRRLLSTAFWFFILISSLVLFPTAALIFVTTALFDRRLVVLHRFTCFWASIYTWMNPAWRVKVEGREFIDPRETYVMVANHLSLLDILVLFRLFRHFKWVSKIENFRVPLVGWNMRLNRYIPLVRGDRESVMKMLELCRRTLLSGSSIMMFPEGTRSADGRLKAFKPGAFQLALETGRPILPIALTGTADALPKKGYVLRGSHSIRVRVLAPIAQAAFAGETPASLAEKVRDVIARAIGAEKA